MLVIIDTRDQTTTNCCPAGSLEQWRLPWYLKRTTCPAPLQLPAGCIVMPPLEIHYCWLPVALGVWVALGLFVPFDWCGGVKQWGDLGRTISRSQTEVWLVSLYHYYPASNHEPPFLAQFTPLNTLKGRTGDHFTVQKIPSEPLGIIPPFDLRQQDIDGCRMKHNSFLSYKRKNQLNANNHQDVFCLKYLLWVMFCCYEEQNPI